MLDKLMHEINSELQEQEHAEFMRELRESDLWSEDFIDRHFLNLQENGVSNEMLKNDMPFLFTEDTSVDEELITSLQAEVDYEDNFNADPIPDSNELTDLQEPVDYKDDFTTEYASDAESETNLTKEVEYNDNQTTPVNVDPYSAESADIFANLGEDAMALEILEEGLVATDGSLTVTPEADKGEEIPQAEPADVDDTEYPTLDKLDGVVMEADDEVAEDIGEGEADDIGVEESAALDEALQSFFEGSYLNEEEKSEDKEDDEESDKSDDEEDKDEDKDEDKEDDEEESDDDEEVKDESAKVCPNCGSNPCKCESAGLDESFDMSSWFDI